MLGTLSIREYDSKTKSLPLLLHRAEPLHNTYHERMGVDVGLEIVHLRLFDGSQVANTPRCACQTEVDGEHLAQRRG